MEIVSDAFPQGVFESTAPGGYQFYGIATVEQLANVKPVDLSSNLKQSERLRFENKGTKDMYMNW